MNYYTEVVAGDSIPARAELVEKLQALMSGDLERVGEDLDYEHHGMEVEYCGGYLHMFDEDGVGQLELLSEDELEVIGQILKEAGMPFWEFGISYTASRKAPGSRGGCYARIYADGSVVTSETTWPS